MGVWVCEGREACLRHRSPARDSSEGAEGTGDAKVESLP